MESKINGRNKIKFKKHYICNTDILRRELKKLEYDEKEPNKAPQKAISLFRKRWWKKYKAPLKHWLITELGHDNTKRIHLHGIIWTELTEEQFEKEWGYGWVYFGYEVNERTINYHKIHNEKRRK